MPEPLDAALAEIRSLLLAPGLTRAVAAGRRRGDTPSVVRAEVRPVALRAGPRLQIVTSDGARPYTRNVAPGPEADAAIDALLAEPFGNWQVRTASRMVQLRVTKKGQAQVHRADAPPAPDDRPAGNGSAPTSQPDGGDAQARGDGPAPTRAPAGQHDRTKEHLLDPGDPLFAIIGGSAAKRRQVDAFLRALAATLPDPLTGRNGDAPLRVVDLGCGNAYLTFAAYRYLTGRGVPVSVVGVDVREDQRRRNTDLAERLGYADDVRFVAGTILSADPFSAPGQAASAPGQASSVPGQASSAPGQPSRPTTDPAGENGAPDVVLALHACDTATDEALARAVGWGARWVLAAPCCHHDIAAQVRRAPTPTPYEALTRHGILRERFADVLTDALRAALLRLHGYKVDVVEFIDSTHTPRNLLLRARHTGAPPTPAQRAEYDDLVGAWNITPALQRLLADPPRAD